MLECFSHKLPSKIQTPNLKQDRVSKHPKALNMSLPVQVSGDTSSEGQHIGVGRQPSVQVLDSGPIITQLTPLPDSDQSSLKTSTPSPKIQEPDLTQDHVLQDPRSLNGISHVSGDMEGPHNSVSHQSSVQILITD